MSKVWVLTGQDVKYSSNAIYYFKKNIELKAPKKAEVNVIADARYKLWINGDMVSFGPQKGSDNESFYQPVDISAYLKDGNNEIFAEVLQLTHAKDIAQHRYLSSVHRSGNVAFLLWGSAECQDGTTEIYTDKSWLCAKEENIDFIVPDYAYYGGLGEKVSKGYKKCIDWKPAKEWIDKDEVIFYGETKLWNIKKSIYPAQKYIPHKLENKDSAGNYDFGSLVTGFVRVKASGKGNIKLTYAESYVFIEDGAEVKKNRADASGEIKGDYDLIYVDDSLEYETFWFRTFRFVKLEADESVNIEEISVMETGYPIKIADNYDFGSERDNKLWEISTRTLKCCMHETYEDCPYYEQLQYAMDTYLQVIFSLKLTNDATLAKRAVHDFAASYSAGNICQSRFPSITPQYIVGFSLYIVMMMDVIERSTGEYEFIKKYLGIVDAMFQGFEEMKREDGLITKSRYWNFMDWANGWEDAHGVPDSVDGDALTVYNLMYAYTLETAAKLNLMFGRDCIAEEYKNNAEQIKETVKKKCFSKEKGLYADTDKCETFSQHPQIWAVLCGLVDVETGKQLMKDSMTLKSKGSFAYAYYVFRALEKVGEYELAEDLMSKYYGLIDQDCTTIPETPENPRSECHAWGAVAIYEFTTMVLGVKECDDCILVKPYINGRDKAKGSVSTKHGMVYVAWERDGDNFNITVGADSEREIRVIMPDNSEVSGKGKVDGQCVLEAGL